MRWLAVALLAVTLVAACGGEKKAAGDRAGDPAAGHALLREYIAGFRILAGGGTADVLDPQLAEQAAKGEALVASGTLSAAFGERHCRLIDVTRAIIAPGGGEAAKQKVRDFLDTVEGKKERSLEGGLAEVAPALAEEVLRLHMLLDGTTDREKTRATWMPELEP